jgi:gliding motility-associated-like protein
VVQTYEWYKNGVKIEGATTATLETRESGVYSVKVGDGCQTGVSSTVRVRAKQCNFVIPNVITPNNDGENDVFRITELDLYKPLSLKVYNRWGKLMYQNSNYLNDWNGDELPSGTYFIHISAPYFQPYKGWLEILR